MLKKKGVLLIVLLLFVSGCTAMAIDNSSSLINDMDDIDQVSISVIKNHDDAGQVHEVIDIVDSQQVRDIVLLAMGIDVQPTDPLRETQIKINNQDSYYSIYEITFSASSGLELDIMSSIKGYFFVLEDENMIFADPSMLMGDEGVNCYISTEAQSEFVSELEEIIRSQAN